MSGGEAKISVIMPVYNAGRYLRGAIDSVLAQTFRDFELILVDDGATDGSGAVCDEYAAKDARVRVKHGRNGGICASRNAGMDLARGEWLAFCDHDDCMEPDLLEQALRAAGGADCNLVKFDHRTFHRFEDGSARIEFTGMKFREGPWKAADLLAGGDYLPFKQLASLVWDGLYRRDFVEAHGLRFDTSFKHGGEDVDFMMRLVAVAGGGVWTAKPVYRHYVNMGVSTSSSCHLELLDDYLRIARREGDLFRAADASLRFARFAEWTVGVILYVFMADGCRLPMKSRISWIERYYDEIVGKGVRVPMRGLLPKRKFLNLCMRWRLVGLYLVLKRIVVCARHMGRRNAGKVRK